MQLDGLNSAFSPVVYGDIALSIKKDVERLIISSVDLILGFKINCNNETQLSP